MIDYFPQKMRETFVQEIGNHPLHSQTLNTVVTKRLVRVGGITFVFRAVEESGDTAEHVVRAAIAAMEAFAIDQMWDRVNEIDSTVPTTAQRALQLRPGACWAAPLNGPCIPEPGISTSPGRLPTFLPFVLQQATNASPSASSTRVL